MPLVRYEVRCEHSLANPELYRSAGRDDPESLLEGVAMAGLVGIVRQLGDLAEFASEIFCGLHDELMTIGSRGHDLNTRVQQLEDELHVVEKALLSEPNQLRFAYTNGADWHASIRSDQNHCTSGDLPCFIRNFYEECRGPPQLFLLDKFDVSGVGACLKRYTDPSFFKLEWASTELMRAQRAQRDKRARREKKKGRRRRTGQPIAAIHQIPARVRYGSASLEDLEGLPHDLASALKVDVPLPAHLGGNRGFDTQTPRGLSRGPKDMLVGDSSSSTLKSSQVPAISNTSQGVKSAKVSAKDIESALGSFLKPNEVEGTTSLAGRISKIIELEDHTAVPATGHTRALGSKGLESADVLEDAIEKGQVLHADLKVRNGISREHSGAMAIACTGGTPRGTPRGATTGEFTVDVREGTNQASNNILSEGRTPRGNLKGHFHMGIMGGLHQATNQKSTLSTTPVGTDLSPTLLKSSSRRSAYMDVHDSSRLSGKFLWRNALDGNEASPLGGRFSRQVSMARSGKSGSEYDEFVDAPSTIDSEGESDFGSPGSIYRPTNFNGDALNHAVLKNHVEAQKAYNAPSMKLIEQLHPLPTFGKMIDNSEVGTQMDDDQLANNVSAGALPKNISPISTKVNEGLSPLASLGQPGTPAGDAHALVQQSRAQNADGNGDLDFHIQVAHFLDIPKKAEESNLLSLLATSPTPSSLDPSSSATSPIHAGKDVLQPSISILSHHSYSSELISVSSDSEPNSHVSPNSPAFHALYSLWGSPSRTSNDLIKSPPTTGAHQSKHSSSSLQEVPVLSESPKYSSRSLDLALVIPIKAEPIHLSSRLGLQLYPLPTPPLSHERDIPSKSREFVYSISGGFGGPISPLQNGESTPAQHSDQGDVHPDQGDVHPKLQLSPTSKHGVVTCLEELASCGELVQQSVISSNVGDSSSSPQYGTPRYFAFIESKRSSAPTSPTGSPKKNFQRVFLSSPSVLSTASPLRTTVDNASCYPSQRDEDNAPSSPSGSVIIKDSPPESPRSSYTRSECESRDFDAIQGRPLTSRSDAFFNHAREYPLSKGEVDDCDEALSTVSMRSKFLHAIEESVSKENVDGDEVASIASLRSKSSWTTATSPEKVQRLLLSPTSYSSSKHQEEISSKCSLDSYVSNGSADHLVSQEKKIPPHSPSIGPQVAPLPVTLKPISTTRSTTKSYKSLTSNSPPDSPGREEQSTNRQWQGKAIPPSTPPRAAFKLPHHPPMRSPLRSPLRLPLHTPRSFWSETGSLKWLGRLDPSLSPKPDFSLPPNLVCHSESSSPACSPPPQLDLDSPTKTILMSEALEDLNSLHTPLVASSNEGGHDEEYYLPNSPNPLASTLFVNANDDSPSRHDSRDDYDDDYVRQNEPQRMVLSATSNSGPLHSLSSLVEDVPSFELVEMEENFTILRRVAEIEHYPEPVGRATECQSFPTTYSFADGETGYESHPVSEVNVDDAFESIEQSRVFASREIVDSHEHAFLKGTDVEVQAMESEPTLPSLFGKTEASSKSISTSGAGSVTIFQCHDHEQASPSLLEESESSCEFEHLSDTHDSVANQCYQDSSPTLCELAESTHLPFDEADVCVGNASPSPLEKAKRGDSFVPMNEADVDGATQFHEQLLPSPAEETGLSHYFAPVINMDSSVAAQSNEQASPSCGLAPELDYRNESVALTSTDMAIEAHSMDSSSSPVPEFELRKTPNTKDALAVAIAQHDKNMLKVLTFQEPVLRPPPPLDERAMFLNQIRTKSFNLRRIESMEKKEPVTRPMANINVAAILEKANAIRQAFVGSDDEDDEDDDWSDS